MSNSQDLDDDLSGLFNSAGSAPRPAPSLPAGYVSPVEKIVQTYREGCPKCHGSGQTRWGVCFKCNGAGGKNYKTSTEQRSVGRAKAAERKAKVVADAVQSFSEAHPDVWAWMNENTQFGFAAAMIVAVKKFGSLTDGQLAACRKCIARDKSFAAGRAAVNVAAAVVDISKIEAAFANARAGAADTGHGIKWLKLLLGTFKFVDAPAGNGYAAAILVREGSAKLGRIQGGRFIASPACSAEKAQEVVAVLDDPSAAARAYGLRTGSCSCCGRELTNAESLKLGIGPICAEKWGL